MTSKKCNQAGHDSGGCTMKEGDLVQPRKKNGKEMHQPMEVQALVQHHQSQGTWYQALLQILMCQGAN